VDLEHGRKCRHGPRRLGAAEQVLGEPQRLRADRRDERVEARADLGDVADRVDRGIRSAQIFVHHDAARRLEPGLLRKLDARRETGGHDDAVERADLARRRKDYAWVHGANVFAVAHDDAFRGEVFMERARLRLGELKLDEARLPMKDRDAVARLVEVGGELAADQAAADHRPARLRTAREDLGAPASQRQQVLVAVEQQEVRPRDGKHRRNARRRAGGEDQLVVGKALAALEDHRTLRPIEAPGLNAGEDTHSSQRVEALEHDLRRRVVAERDAVRKARPGVVAARLRGDQHDVLPRALSERLGERDAGEPRADDERLHAATREKSAFVTPQSGQLQVSGTSSQRVPGAMPCSGSPAASS